MHAIRVHTKARLAGADFVGGADLAEKIKGGWLDFTRCIATPDMMPQVAQARFTEEAATKSRSTP